MMTKTTAVLSAVLLASTALAQSDPLIQWFGTWEDARAEAQRTNRPILLTSAAPACQGVSGIW